MTTNPWRFRRKPAKWQCPYCLQPVGVLGNWFAKLFGTRIHDCDWSNVKSPEEP